jgi:hypothetical protein
MMGAVATMDDEPVKRRRQYRRGAIIEKDFHAARARAL